MLTITYGVGNSVTKPEDSYRSVGQVLCDTSIQTVLNFDPAQVEPRIGGQVVDIEAAVTPGMRIDLVKKAGRKSDNDYMNIDQQLRPLAVNDETLRVIRAHASAALIPIYEAFTEAENEARKEMVAAQRNLLKGCKSFATYVDAIVEALVNRTYLDTQVEIPADVREELDAIAAATEENLMPLRQAVADKETLAAAWSRAVEADLRMCLVVQEQRIILAKALKSDALKAWNFEAAIK